ncbi:MAG: cytochrome C [Deltaproteobacteria bacterium]|nr:cytochrome C [Deltaproteobacteria bacterium]
MSAGERKTSELPDRVHAWPHLVKVEFIAALLMLAFLLAWSILLDAPLEEPANPAVTPDPSKAPWYFVGLQELLVYFDPWIAGVLLPLMILTGLVAIPYVDRNPKGNGGYTLRERPFALAVFLFGFLGLWIVPIVVGALFRGPGWHFYWPWETWEVGRAVAAASVDLPWLLGARGAAAQQVVGGGLVLAWLFLTLAGPWLLWRRRPFFVQLGLLRWLVVGVHLSVMLGVVVKVALRLLFSVKYVWVTPWFSL